MSSKAQPQMDSIPSEVIGALESMLHQGHQFYAIPVGNKKWSIIYNGVALYH